MKGKTDLKLTIDLKGTTGLTQDRPEVKPTLKEKKNRQERHTVTEQKTNTWPVGRRNN